jgi:PAS domain S-box-containing protein
MKIAGIEFKNKENVRLEKPVSEPIRIDGKIKGRLTIGYTSGSLNISEYEARLIKQYAERLGTIIESRENQDALRIKSRALETSISAFAFENMDGIVTYVNPSFVKLWGFDSAEEIIGRPIHHFFGLRIPYDEISAKLKINRFWQGELTAMKKDGTFFHVHESANLMHDKDGNPLFLMGSYIDITEIKKLQERLIQSERLAATGQLVAAIAHEINSPLQAITFLLDSLGKKSSFDLPFKSDVELLKEAFGRIRDTVKDLLTLNKPGKEKRQITNVNRIIEGNIDISRNYLKGRRIEIECALSPEVPDIIASPQHLGQLFLNLLNNSVEAMMSASVKKKWAERTPLLGKVSISSFLQNGDIMIIFEDTGPGIEPEDLLHVFDPFFTKKKIMGMGVGLSICYNIVKEHNGNISASNATEGGARFTITFPLKSNNAQTS